MGDVWLSFRAQLGLFWVQFKKENLSHQYQSISDDALMMVYQ